ncbi:Hypothetical predicted protein [Paramuricea clavata]|uniref:Uncharacterized protein n=1 Tax=Paramuricea clavata TaxID=317549 RepID=A0A6S7HNQ3_PARCT|nr:Hypothetical predicted protein [Paramuricea clavata]
MGDELEEFLLSFRDKIGSQSYQKASKYCCNKNVTSPDEACSDNETTHGVATETSKQNSTVSKTTEYPTTAKRPLQNRQRNVEEQIRANRQELQVMQVRLESMNINVPELPEIGRYKVVCGNCHHRGHRNQQTKPCIMERCSSFTYCGIKDKHPEYRMKCAIKKRATLLNNLKKN